LFITAEPELPPVVSALDRKFTGTVPSTGSLNTP
jgi:hypothetical protein